MARCNAHKLHGEEPRSRWLTGIARNLRRHWARSRSRNLRRLVYADGSPGDPAPKERLVADFDAEAAPLVRREGGVLLLNESPLDKPDARAIDLTARHWSGKHRRVVRGSNRISRL